MSGFKRKGITSITVAVVPTFLFIAAIAFASYSSAREAAGAASNQPIMSRIRCCGMMGGGSGGMGGMMEGGMGGMMGGGMMGGTMEEMHTMMGLFHNTELIERKVTDIPEGVETTTVSRDSGVENLIREHVWQMKSRLEAGQPIRRGDPLFREIFKHHGEIDMEIEDVRGGVKVRETSDNPRVALLIRQHARRAVSEFIDQGMPRMMRPTPLPHGY